MKTPIFLVLAMSCAILGCKGHTQASSLKHDSPFVQPVTPDGGVEELSEENAEDELREEDRENMALSDCLGICDMEFNCRDELESTLGKEETGELIGKEDDMEICHGKCMNRIYTMSEACLDCHDLDFPCEKMAMCIEANCKL